MGQYHLSGQQLSDVVEGLLVNILALARSYSASSAPCQRRQGRDCLRVSL